MDSSFEVYIINWISLTVSVSLNFIIFALELILIEPNLSYIPNTLDNQRCSDLFLNNAVEFLNILEYITERDERVFCKLLNYLFTLNMNFWKAIPTEKKFEQINEHLRNLNLNPDSMECESIGTTFTTLDKDFMMMNTDDEKPTQINVLKRSRDEEAAAENSWLKQVKIK